MRQVSMNSTHLVYIDENDENKKSGPSWTEKQDTSLNNSKHINVWDLQKQNGQPPLPKSVKVPCPYAQNTDQLDDHQELTIRQKYNFMKNVNFSFDKPYEAKLEPQ